VVPFKATLKCDDLMMRMTVTMLMTILMVVSIMVTTDALLRLAMSKIGKHNLHHPAKNQA
jgi:hypothetical protein